MKNNKLSLLLIIPLLSSVGLVSCKAEEELSFFIVSDLHYLSSSLAEDEIKEVAASDGRVQQFDTLLVDNLVKKINEEKPDYVMLTGDLSFSGEKASHQDLAEKLKEVTDSKILVIPGNHDINNLTSYDYSSGGKVKTANVDYDEFKEIYQSFGFTDAVNYDTDSLSYFYKLDDNYYALMLDTSLSEYNKEEGYNIVGGGLSDTTLAWMEENLKSAKENNKKVISFTHHNLLNHNPNFTSMYTLYNAEDVLNLYKEYNVTFGFSGHLHIQSISSDDDYTDIASGAMIVYNNSYGIFTISKDKKGVYSAYSLLDDEKKEESFNTFCTKYYNKSISRNTEKYGEENGTLVTDFISKINGYYFAGEYKTIHKEINAHPEIMDIINDTNDGSYNSTILNVEDKDQTCLELDLN